MTILAFAPQADKLGERAGRVAAIAARFADDVDRAGRFPREAAEALKAERLLGIQVPEKARALPRSPRSA